MIVIIPFCAKDYSLAVELVNWIRALGGTSSHDAALLTDPNFQWSDCVDLLSLANGIFCHVELITSQASVEGWPQGSNALFKRACEYAQERNEPFLWLEPDAIPMKPDWLGAISEEYAKCGKPFMGHVYANENPSFPKHLMSGVAVYPANALQLLKFGASAFDVLNATTMVNNGHPTKLIHHIWGDRNWMPTFAYSNVKGTNVFCPAQFPDARIFHRCKDGSLIRILRRLLGIRGDRDFVVTIPFCATDGNHQSNNVSWMLRMGQPKTHDALLSYDSGTSQSMVDSIMRIAVMVFKSVDVFSYPQPPVKTWPAAPNHAFQYLAMHMYERVRRPWLFLEYDEIPVCPDWLIKLQAEYDTCGKPFMGHRVEMLGHMNGGGIYPYNFPEYSQKGMMADALAWDWVCKDDIIPHLHAANHLIEQCTKVINGVPNIHQGEVPTFRTQGDVDRLLKPGIVLFHRCKDGTLIQRLQERLARK